MMRVYYNCDIYGEKVPTIVLVMFCMLSGTTLVGQTELINDHWQSGLVIEKSYETHKDTLSLKDILLGHDQSANLVDHSGDTLTYQDIKGKVLLLDFWFLRCKPCIAELTGFDILNKKYKNKNFKVVSIIFDEYEEVNAKLLSKRSFNYSIYTDTHLLGTVLYPLKMIINKEGKLVYHKNNGSFAKNAHLELVDKLSPIIDKWLDQ